MSDETPEPDPAEEKKRKAREAALHQIPVDRKKGLFIFVPDSDSTTDAS